MQDSGIYIWMQPWVQAHHQMSMEMVREWNLLLVNMHDHRADWEKKGVTSNSSHLQGGKLRCYCVWSHWSSGRALCIHLHLSPSLQILALINHSRATHSTTSITSSSIAFFLSSPLFRFSSSCTHTHTHDWRQEFTELIKEAQTKMSIRKVFRLKTPQMNVSMLSLSPSLFLNHFFWPCLLLSALLFLPLLLCHCSIKHTTVAGPIFVRLRQGDKTPAKQ